MMKEIRIKPSKNIVTVLEDIDEVCTICGSTEDNAIAEPIDWVFSTL